MKKPLIGLTPSHNTDNHDIQMRPTYIKAVTAAGAIPVVLPLTSSEEDLKQLVDTLDGFLFTEARMSTPSSSGKRRWITAAVFPRKGIRWSLRSFPWLWRQASPSSVSAAAYSC